MSVFYSSASATALYTLPVRGLSNDNDLLSPPPAPPRRFCLSSLLWRSNVYRSGAPKVREFSSVMTPAAWSLMWARGCTHAES